VIREIRTFEKPITKAENLLTMPLEQTSLRYKELRHGTAACRSRIYVKAVQGCNLFWPLLTGISQQMDHTIWTKYYSFREL
jgi:hypothetical protein